MQANAGALCTKEVDGVTFEFYHVSPRELIALLWRIAGLLGMSMKGEGGGKIDVGNMEVGSIVANLFEKADEKMLYHITDRLFVNCLVIGNEEFKGGYLRDKVVWDNAFTGPHGQMRFFKVVVTAMEVYYGDFFADLSGLLGIKAGALKKVLTGALATKTSTGGPGDLSSPTPQP